MNAIELTHINKSFCSSKGRLPVLFDVNLEVAEGEAFGFIGANGAGKSTTIKIIMDILRADSGTARLFGADCRDPKARRGVAYLPENPYLYDYLTPLELVTMGLAQHRVTCTDARQYAMQWLDKFAIAEAANKRIRSLSKGMTQRTALAHALACQPRLLILDEPLSGLDPVGRRDVVDILLEYRKAGGALFFTSHVLFDVERIADRFGLIHKGRIAVVKTATDLFTDSQGVFVIQVEADEPLPEYVHEFGKRWLLEIHREGLWDKLRQIEQAGHSILSVKPHLTLERAFFEYVHKEA